MAPRRFQFDARRRLSQRAQFDELLRQGTRKSLGGYTFYIRRRSGGVPRLGILVTKQHSARASERNRLKRCIREAFRLEQAVIGPIDLLVRPPYGLKGDSAARAQLRGLFGKLGR